MNFNDSRSFRVVVMADYFMNPQQYSRSPTSEEVYEYLRDSGFGIIKMPPPGTPKRAIPGWVSSVVDQIQEYRNRDFKVFLLGVDFLAGKGIWLSELRKELASRGMIMPPMKSLSIADLKGANLTRSLQAFLPR